MMYLVYTLYSHDSTTFQSSKLVRADNPDEAVREFIDGRGSAPEKVFVREWDEKDFFTFDLKPAYLMSEWPDSYIAPTTSAIGRAKVEATNA